MAQNEIGQFDEIDNDNTDISGTTIVQGQMYPYMVDNAFRNLAGMLKRWFKTSLFRLRDSTDQTKLLAFDLSTVPTATTISVRVQDKIQVIRRQVFTASGTYTPHANMLYCIVESIGGGGAGGGVVGAASGGASGGGGGSGGYTRSILTKAAVGASQAVTIGAAGIASAASTGGNGGITTFGALNTANGGFGGLGGNAATTTAGAGGLGATAASAGTELYAGGSGQGGYTAAPGVTVAMQGTNGGTTVFGGAGYGIINDGGYPGRAPGAGGGGASSFNSASNRNGGAGAAGIVIVTEFCSQ